MNAGISSATSDDFCFAFQQGGACSFQRFLYGWRIALPLPSMEMGAFIGEMEEIAHWIQSVLNNPETGNLFPGKDKPMTGFALDK